MVQLTCRAIVKRALRKISALPAAMEPSTDEANAALAHLQSIYLQFIGSGAFGRQNDVYVEDLSYTAFEQDRILCYNTEGVAIELPVAFTPGDNDTIRPPYDGSIITVTDGYSSFSRNYVYDAYIGRWTLIEDLRLNSRAPFAARYGEGLASKLAVLIAPDYSATVPRLVNMAAAKLDRSIGHRFDAPSRPTVRPQLTPVLSDFTTDADFDDDSLALFDAMDHAPTVARRFIIDAFIVALKAGNVWDRLDLLQVLCANDVQAASLNWVNPGSNNVGTGGGLPTFTQDRGYTFAGSPDYLTTNFTPSTDATQMSGGTIVNAMIAVYERANVGSNRVAAGGLNATSQSLAIIPRTGSNFSLSVNCAVTAFTGAGSDSRGLTVGQREADDTLAVYKNGVLAGTSATATGNVAPGSRPLFIGARNNNGTADLHRATTLGLVAAGRRLTSSQQAALYAATQDYMTALGANV